MEKAIPKILVPNTQARNFNLAGVHNEINPSLITLIKEGKLNPKPLMVCSGGTSTRCASENHWTLDLRDQYKSIKFDHSKNEVVIEAGVTMKELILKLSKEKRTFPIGLSGSTGIGYILTGGISPLSRSYGLAIDNIIDIKGVWGNGNIFKISKPNLKSSIDEKFLWRALCGAAPFLAIITSLRLKTQSKNSIYVWESVLNPMQLADLIIRAEDWPHYASLSWSWQKYIKVSAVFEIKDSKTAKGIDLLIDELPKTKGSKSYIISTLLDLPNLNYSDSGFSVERKKYSEVLGILGNKWGNKAYEVVNKLESLMNQRPDICCSISAQQLGGYTSTISKETTSFIHRDSVWKPWITASWEAEDHFSKNKSLEWLEEVWKSMEPICPGVHLAQLHHHLSWHKKETNAAFNDWMPTLQKLKSKYDPKGILPSI